MLAPALVTTASSASVSSSHSSSSAVAGLTSLSLMNNSAASQKTPTIKETMLSHDRSKSSNSSPKLMGKKNNTAQSQSQLLEHAVGRPDAGLTMVDSCLPNNHANNMVPSAAGRTQDTTTKYPTKVDASVSDMPSSLAKEKFEQRNMETASTTASIPSASSSTLVPVPDAYSYSSPAYYYYGPILFALLPSFCTRLLGTTIELSDIFLILQLAICLYYIIKIPWELYQSSRSSPSDKHVSMHIQCSPECAAENNRRTARAHLKHLEHVYLALTLLAPFTGGAVLHLIKKHAAANTFSHAFLQPISPSHFVFASCIRPVLHFASLAREQTVALRQEICYPCDEVENLKIQMKKLSEELCLTKLRFSETYLTRELFETCIGTSLDDLVSHPLTSRVKSLTHLDKDIKKCEKRIDRCREWMKDRFGTLEDQFLLIEDKIPPLIQDAVTKSQSPSSTANDGTSNHVDKKPTRYFRLLPNSIVFYLIRIWFDWAITILALPLTIIKTLTCTSMELAKGFLGAIMFGVGDRKLVEDCTINNANANDQNINDPPPHPHIHNGREPGIFDFNHSKSQAGSHRKKILHEIASSPNSNYIKNIPKSTIAGKGEIFPSFHSRIDSGMEDNQYF